MVGIVFQVTSRWFDGRAETVGGPSVPLPRCGVTFNHQSLRCLQAVEHGPPRHMQARMAMQTKLNIVILQSMVTGWLALLFSAIGVGPGSEPLLEFGFEVVV